MKPSKKSTFYEALKQQILTLAIAPGSVLDETQISEEFELSRTPLREVFQRLAGEGYLNLEENRGAKVSSMDLTSMRFFFQTAPMIYASVARLAAENATSNQLEMLKGSQQSFRRSSEAGDAVEMSIHNHSFHSIMGEMASNPYLVPSLNRLLIDHTRMGHMFFHPINSSERNSIWKACDQHDQMIEAIERKASAEMVELTLEHWNLSRDRINQFVKPDPLPVEPEINPSEEDEDKGLQHAV